MSTSLETDPSHDEVRTTRTELAINQLRHQFAACRVKFKWLGTSKTLSAEQKSQAAESFGADGQSISAGKKLIDTKHEAYKSLTSLKSQVCSYWKDNSLPYPEPGIRLIRQDRVEDFNAKLVEYQGQLETCVRDLENHYSEIVETARQRLGSLFDYTDYPSSLTDEFEVTWDFPTVEPPDYLRRLNPELFEEQSRRVSQRFERAVELAEQAFMEELDRLVNHLAERLSGDEDGRPRVFRDTAITNLREFFQRFRDLNIGSSEQLDELVSRCEQVMEGVQPSGLRNNEEIRRNLSTNLAAVQSSLDQLMVDRPRRNILRPNRQDTESE